MPLVKHGGFEPAESAKNINMTFYFRAGKITRGLSNETQLTSLEEAQEDALEVAQETNATRETNEETVIKLTHGSMV